MELKLCFMGLGSVGRELIKLIDRKREDVQAQHNLSFRVVGIATGRHGILIEPDGIDQAYALGAPWGDRTWPSTEENRLKMIRECGADAGAAALVEMSPINRQTGRPALDYLELALTLKMHAISANKGPVVYGYRHLRDLAQKQGKAFLFEATVMDGFPLLNLYRECLPATRVLSFRAVLNSTTNLILTLMEEGKTFDEAVRHAVHVDAEVLHQFSQSALPPERYARELQAAVRYAVAMQEHAGLDVLTDGEWGRKSYIGVIAELAHGFELGTFPDGTVRFGFSYFNTLEQVDYALGIIEQLVGDMRNG